MSGVEQAGATEATVTVVCAGTTYRGVLLRTRVEFGTEKGVLVSILVREPDGELIRFFFKTDDAEAWKQLEHDPRPKVIQAEAMKREGRAA